MSRRPNNTPDENAERMNAQAWVGLRRVGQPVIVGICLGKLIIEISQRYADSYHGLVVPAMAWPMVGLSIASCVNLSIEDTEMNVRNYVYYGLIGLLASAATLSSTGTQFFFEQLNDGILKGVFTGTLVTGTKDTETYSSGLTLGFNAMVGFHTLYAVFQRRIYNLAFQSR
jgi:hypothetical protein